jgi:hypothetical protein
MAGRSAGAHPDFVIYPAGGARDPNLPVYLKETEMRSPSMTWLVADEDEASINDGMLLVDVSGTVRFYDLPSRAHGNAYGINFNDGHAEIYKFLDAASINWQPSGADPLGGLRDWMALTNVTTHPL